MSTRAPGLAPAWDWLDRDSARRLELRLDAGLRRARTTGTPVLASVTATVDPSVDPTAVALASRRADEPWFCLEQPDRDGSAVAAIGCVRALDARGTGRFDHVARRWSALNAAALADAVDGPPGSGLVAVGGFAFASDGGTSARWEGFAPASMIVPEVSLARGGKRVSLTVNVEIAADDTVEDLRARVGARLDSLRSVPLPMLDPAPAGNYRVLSPMPPSHYEEAVARAVQRIRGGEFEKIVLARDVEVHAPVEHDVGAVLGLLREAFPSCYTFAVGRGDAAFLAASPELLVRRDGQRASTVALAGSARRSADPAIDDHLGEQLLQSEKDREENAIVVRRIARALRPHAVWVTAAPEPALVRVANIQHLATPIRAQLAAPLSAIELAGILHPTPGGRRRAARRGREADPGPRGPRPRLVRRHGGVERRDRRRRVLRGPALRAAAGTARDAVRGRWDRARLRPVAELAETEVKLGALLPVLSG